MIFSVLCLLCGLAFLVGPAMPQTASVDPDLPYGGPYVTPGSWAVGPGAPPPASGACSGSTDPCVLTGQYNQHRNSLNGNASNLGKLAGSGDYSNFGLAYLYPVTNCSLTYLWDSPVAPTVCSSGPTVTSWYTASFTEPTLADVTESGTKYGAVYVPTVCSVNNGTTYKNCGSVASGGAVSGVLVFANCP